MSNCIQLKTSVIKGIKNQLLDQFPDIESWLNHIMPKKDPVKIVRWYDLFFLTKDMQCVFCVVDFLPNFIFLMLYSSRSHEHIEILTVNGELLFFRQREGPFYPTLRLLHKCELFSTRQLGDGCLNFLILIRNVLLLFIDPFILPHQQVDKGAIKFVLSGANIMCPGLTSPGAKLYPADVDTVVVSFYT